MAANTLLGVGLAVMLRDQFSGPATRINQQSQYLKQNLAALASAQSQFYRNLGFTSVAMASAWYGLSRVIEAGARYKYTLISVQAVTESTNAELARMDKLAMELGQNTIFHSDQVADAMKYMGMAGMKYAEIMGSIPAAVNLAGATDSALQGKLGTADIMTNIMKTFQLGVEHAASVGDILTVATVKANTNLTDLAQGIKYAGSTANSLNIPLQELTAGLMLLSNAGIQGSMAGVAMENAMRYFARALGPQATGRQVKALQQLGLSTEDFMDKQGRMLSLPVVFEKLQAAMKRVGTGTIAGQNILDNLFGVRGKRAATLLVRDGDQLKGFINDLNNSAGKSQEIMDMRMESLYGHILQFITVVKHLGIVFTDAITPTLKFMLKGINGVLRGLVSLAQNGFVKSFIIPMTTVLLLSRLWKMAIRLAGMGMDILKIKSNLATGEAISGTTKATGVMSSLTKAIFGATAAQQGLTAAVMGTTRAYQAQGAAGAMAMGGAGMGPMVYTNSRGKKTMPDGWAGYVKATKGKNPWTAPQKMNGQWVIYNPQQGNKVFETREAARQFRRQYTPENYRPATAEEIKKGWGVSWFGTAPGTTKAEKAAQAAKNVGKVGFWSKLLGWMPWLGRIGGWFSKALPWITRIGGLLGRVVGFLTGPWGLAITMLVSIGTSLWSWLSGNNKEEEKQTEILKNLAQKDAEGLIDNGSPIRVFDQWVNTHQGELRSFQAEAMKSALDPGIIKNLYGVNAAASKFGSDVTPAEVTSNRTNIDPIIHLNFTIGDETFQRVYKASMQKMVVDTINEQLGD